MVSNLKTNLINTGHSYWSSSAWWVTWWWCWFPGILAAHGMWLLPCVQCYTKGCSANCACGLCLFTMRRAPCHCACRCI
jgi:hypothetical protein